MRTAGIGRVRDLCDQEASAFGIWGGLSSRLRASSRSPMYAGYLLDVLVESFIVVLLSSVVLPLIVRADGDLSSP